MVRIGSALLASWLLLSAPAAAVAQAGPAPIVGVWKVTAVETRDTASGRVVRPFGDTPTGVFIFTPGGQMIGMQYGSNRKAPANPNPTDAERTALHASMSAYSGRYRLEGRRVLIDIEDSSIQSWNGTTRVINVEHEGRRMTGTSEPFKSLVSGTDVVAVVVWERVE